ncbi:XRE family transcriptional regulator [Metapseudomonas furukawaii]|uniref:IrrE N-terminal-like domain-containing protein n=1 Tax=Metapseudomonas furukawaii TaxID=1149133 RepID=A0AAD1C306_METFU|nr:XRE family transcriptional regulator [Pseudomonas furukawaii]ELS29299.1 transcriptional regulator, XRE family protein [Pseudomonas furukawaii]BAU76486.1 hypothetical protein KF707C_47980 [Pseudomonas furukawaii]
MVSIKEAPPKEELDLVFGPSSSGDSLLERARTSRQCFVRSQVQVAPASPEATGRVFSASEALAAFGWEIIRRAILEGAAPIISSPQEPAATLKVRRSELGLSTGDVSRRAGCSESELLRAETEGERSPYRTLERIGAALALDERKLGIQANPGRDAGLGVRLRELTGRGGDMAAFGPSTVLGLTEAAWVIARQDFLSDSANEIKAKLPAHDSNFSYPAYQVGFSLAAKTRKLLDLTDDQPIESVRELIEDKLGIPLIQHSLNSKFAGATISNGTSRGIVINENGMNSNVWVRRMTLSHELGHLLWDPEDKLEKVRADDYGDLDEDVRISKRDPAEIRANAFAVAFLAPPSAIKKLAAKESNPAKVISEIMTMYGIGGTAAKHHYQNITGIKIGETNLGLLPEPDDGWVAAENLSIDYFPINNTPITRRGRFAWLVARLCTDNFLSLDTAASYLNCSQDEAKDNLSKIISLWQTN